ncbi:MAG: energy transducer TonB [Candidatus Aminicenantes bacterium]|nr:energy transducer TonB [Candidatus Aminicenantes bacterium]
MSKPFLSWIVMAIAGLALLPSDVRGAKQTLTVRIWLFQGTVAEAGPGLERTEILPVSSTPEFAALRASTGSSDNDFKAAVIEALLDRQGLRTLEDMFLFKQSQREDLPFGTKVVLGRQVAYRIGLSHKVAGPMLTALRIVLARTKEGVLRPEKDDRTMLRNAYEASLDEDKMAVIVDQALEVGFDDPVVVTVPHGDRPFFMVVKLTANEPEPPRRKAAPTLKLPPLSNLVPAPRALDKVLPAYPDELRRRGIRGDVGLRIAIDEEGFVSVVQVISSLHPYLDYAASQAFWQWRFEPVVREGKAVPASFKYTFVFSPESYAEETAAVVAPAPAAEANVRQEIETMLAAAANYCRKLREVALFYVCEESIKETTHALVSSDRLAELSLRAGDRAIQVYADAAGREGWIVEKPQIMSIRNVDRLGYSCDYQMIRRFGDIEERRIVLRANGRKITDRVELLEESRYAACPVLSSSSASEVFGYYHREHGMTLDSADWPATLVRLALPFACGASSVSARRRGSSC